MIIDFSNINGGGGGGYVLPIASSQVLGGVKVGQNLTIDSGGTLNAVGGEQDYQIVSAITDYTAGKMYAVVAESEYEKVFSGMQLYCGNQHTDFIGVVEDNNSNSSFNPWIQNSTIFIDTYIDRDASTGINTLTVKYGNDTTIINETLSEGDNVFALPTLETLSGVILTVTVEITESNIVYSVVYSGSSLYENRYYIHQNVWEYNENIMLEQASTVGNELRFDGISYTDGTAAHSITDVASYYTTGVVKIGTGINVDSAGTISVISSSYADVDDSGIKPKILTKTDGLDENTFGIMPMSALSDVMITDESGFTLDMSYYPTDINMVRIANIYIGQYQIEYNFYNDGVLFENKDTNDNWNIVSSGIITTNSTDVWDNGEVYESHTSLKDNILSVHLTTTDIGIQVGNAPMAVLRVGWTYKPFKVRTANVIATTASTGVVKVGDYLNIDASGTLSVNASSITNGVSFWKGTQAEYDALSGTTGYDSSTLYIITDTPNAV